MNFLGKIVGLCFMALCVCAPSFFGLFRKESFALSKNVTNISSTASLTAGSKVYFGEYPQDSVIKVSKETGWEKLTIVDSEGSHNAIKPLEVGVNKNSIVAHNTIKGYIEELLKVEYGDDYQWHYTTVGKFTPRRSRQTDKISYDYITGYYTLLVDVIENTFTGDANTKVTYPAGSKFYAYNRVVDALNKYYMVEVDETASSWKAESPNKSTT